MNKNHITFALALLLAWTPGFWLRDDAQTQRKSRQQTQAPTGNYLPPAQFPNYAGSAQFNPGANSSANMTNERSDLPVVNGLHLDGAVGRPDGVVRPYDAGEPSLNGALVRWDVSRFPLKVWISEGKKLPDVPWEQITQDRVPRVLSMLSTDPKSLDALPIAPGWNWHMNEWAANGFEMWRLLEQQGIVSYAFVDDPSKADIMVFFTDHFMGADGPGGTSVHGQTYGQVFTAQQVKEKMRLAQRPMPIVMELRISVDERRMTGDAAHEFGHALGIKAHSPYNNDIMYVNRIVDEPSQSDFATVKALYKVNPQYWYY